MDDPVIRPFLLSSWFSSSLFMAEIFGFYYYITTFWHKDVWPLRATVVLACGVDLVGIIFQLVQVDFYIRYNWGFPTTIATIIAGLAQGINAYIVQMFLSWRFWTLSRNLVITLLLVAISTASFGGIWGLSIREVFHHAPEDVPTYKPYFIVWLSCGVAADILIAISLVFMLNSMNADFRSTRSMIHKIIYMTVGTGAFTALLASAMLIVYVVDPMQNYTAIGMPLGRLYTLNVLILVLSRKNLRGTSVSQDVSLGAIHISRTTMQHTDTTSTRLNTSGTFKETVNFDDQVSPPPINDRIFDTREYINQIRTVGATV